MRRMAVLAVALGMVAFASRGEEIRLFNGSDLTGWKPFLDKSTTPPEEVWSIDGGVLTCKGKPTGYIRTEKEFRNYILTLEWRFPPGSRGGNSGVLLHMVGEDKIWPKSIEAQLQSKEAGDFWVIDGASIQVENAKKRTAGRRTLNLTNDSEKPIGQWNKYVIVCAGDTIALIVNGDLVNYAWKCSLDKGYICLQSEGVPIEFRNIVLRTFE